MKRILLFMVVVLAPLGIACTPATESPPGQRAAPPSAATSVPTPDAQPPPSAAPTTTSPTRTNPSTTPTMAPESEAGIQFARPPWKFACPSKDEWRDSLERGRLLPCSGFAMPHDFVDDQVELPKGERVVFLGVDVRSDGDYIIIGLPKENSGELSLPNGGKAHFFCPAWSAHASAASGWGEVWAALDVKLPPLGDHGIPDRRFGCGIKLEPARR